MVVAVIAIVVGLAVGYASGGSWRALAAITLRRPWLLALAIAAQLSAAVLAGQLTVAPSVALTAGAVCAAAFVAVNRGMPGLALVAAGLLSNTIAILANSGRMPVSLEALVRNDTGFFTFDRLHQAAGPHTRLAFLTDQIAVPLPQPFAEVLSVGDVLVAAGCGLFCFAAVRGVRPAWQDGSHGKEGSQASRT